MNNYYTTAAGRKVLMYARERNLEQWMIDKDEARAKYNLEHAEEIKAAEAKLTADAEAARKAYWFSDEAKAERAVARVELKAKQAEDKAKELVEFKEKKEKKEATIKRLMKTPGAVTLSNGVVVIRIKRKG